MKVPFSLRKADRPCPASALLLPSANAADLLALCTRLAAAIPASAREWPALPPICPLPGGFLVKLAHPVSAIFPGTIRLRAVAVNLFVPVDAELVPTLLDDEAAALARQRGLIFLPGGRVLAFSPDRLLTADALLTLPRLPARPWRSLPARPARPEQLREILLDLPDDTPAAILESGGEDIGTETPRPADSGTAAKTMGQAALGMSRGLLWLGQLLRWPGLAKLGAALAARAVQRVPRLSESLLGRQDAALRELLRRFREGNLDDALRHALPLANSSGRGSRAASGANLPTHNLFYRLADLLSGGVGAASVWFGSGDVHAELSREYRKAAESATARGDYRRAAYIYGRLLHDYRLAAAALERGGLHHDAAILYLEVLSDTLAAARAFEAAGETDRALQLYLQRGEYANAGDLLRRGGEEEEAVRHYLLAADQLAAARNHLGAGDLLAERALRPDLGARYFADGWAARPRDNAIPCLMRLTRWYVDRDNPRDLLALVAEAEDFFAPPGNATQTSHFFNELAQLAERPHLSPLRDDLRDRALRALAGKLRTHVGTDQRPGTTVSALLGQSGAWKAELVSDADFALKAALKKKARPPSTPKPDDRTTRFRVHAGEVSAVCVAPDSGRVFLGFANGIVAGFDPLQNASSVSVVQATQGPIVSLATNERGNSAIALGENTPDTRELVSLGWSGADFRLYKRQRVPSEGAAWLTPIATDEGHAAVGLWRGDHLSFLWCNDLVPWGRKEVGPDAAARSGLLFLHNDASANGCLFCGDALWCFSTRGEHEDRVLHCSWRPCSQLRGLCSPPPLSFWWRDRQHLEIAGVDEDDSIHWTELDYSHSPWPALGGGASNAEGKYLAACLLGPGRLAGVTSEGFVWLSRERYQLRSRGLTPARLENAVACALSPRTRELLVICRDGVVVRTPLPN